MRTTHLVQHFCTVVPSAGLLLKNKIKYFLYKFQGEKMPLSTVPF
jgi:hypothetical protein